MRRTVRFAMDVLDEALIHLESFELLRGERDRKETVYRLIPRRVTPLEKRSPSGPCTALHARAGPPPRQPNVPIQPAMARPISSGASSWRKWIPATVTSAC